jgi:hypothetical protein
MKKFLGVIIIFVFSGCVNKPPPTTSMGMLMHDFVNAYTPSPKLIRAREKYEKKTVEKICKNEPLVGEESGFQALLNAKREELNSIQAEIGFKKYTRLSQELKGHSVEWEILNKHSTVGCSSYALCLSRYAEEEKCRITKQEYENSLENARKFLLQVKELEFKK